MLRHTPFAVTALICAPLPSLQSLLFVAAYLLVTALRETSIIFALLLGVSVLKEGFNPTKVLATALTSLGIGLLGVGH